MAGLRIDAQRPALLRGGEKSFGQLQGQFVRGDLIVEVRSLRGGLTVVADDHPFQVRTVLPYPHVDRATLIVVEQRNGVDLAGIDALQVHAHQFLEAAGTGDRMRYAVLTTEVEVVQPIGAPLVTGGDLVEFILHGGGEVVVDQTAEVLLQQTGHREGNPRGHQGRALLVHISPVLNGLDNRGIR